LKAPVKRLSAPYSPIPFSPPLEKAYLPSAERIFEAAKSLLR